MKKKKIYVLIMAVALLFSLTTNMEASATGIAQSQVIDLETMKIGSGKLALTSDNKLYVTGADYQGTFGPVDGLEGYNNFVNGFTLANTSAIQGKMIDISSGGTITYILTDEGTVYGTSYTDPVTYEILRQWKKIDQSNFEGKPVTKIMRDQDGYVSFMTNDGSVYVTANPYTIEAAKFTKMNLPDGVAVSQIMVARHGLKMFLLDTSGKVWIEENVFMASGGYQAFQWVPAVLPTDGQDVLIKELGVSTGSSNPFFITTDGRLMYYENYTDLQGNYMPSLGSNELGFTEISNVDSFVEDLKYHSTSDSYGYPIIKKMDGSVYGSRAIIEDMGGTPTSTDNMINFGNYIPNINGASKIALYVDNPFIAGNYIVNGTLYAVNGSSNYSNGVFYDSNNPIPPLTVTGDLVMSEFVYNPDQITFDHSVNPKSAILGPGLHSTTKVQANWQIVDQNNQVIQSGVIPFVDANGVTLDIAGLNLPEGEYTLNFFRETTPDEATYLRSGNTSIATFSIVSNTDPVVVEPVNPPADQPVNSVVSKVDNSKADTPKTGDETNIMGIGLLLIGATGALILMKRRVVNK